LVQPLQVDRLFNAEDEVYISKPDSLLARQVKAKFPMAQGKVGLRVPGLDV